MLSEWKHFARMKAWSSGGRGPKGMRERVTRSGTRGLEPGLWMGMLAWWLSDLDVIGGETSNTKAYETMILH